MILPVHVHIFLSSEALQGSQNYFVFKNNHVQRLCTASTANLTQDTILSSDQLLYAQSWNNEH